MKLMIRIATLLIAALCSIFTSQWVIRRLYLRSQRYVEFSIGEDDLR